MHRDRTGRVGRKRNHGVLRLSLFRMRNRGGTEPLAGCTSTQRDDVIGINENDDVTVRC